MGTVGSGGAALYGDEGLQLPVLEAHVELIRGVYEHIIPPNIPIRVLPELRSRNTSPTVH